MARHPLALLAAALLVSAPPAALAQRPPSTAAIRRAAEGLTADGMRQEIGRLSDDSTRGRDTPSPELDKVAAYIAGEFRRLGLRPAGDSGDYLQRYAIRCSRIDSTSFVEVTAGGVTARWPVGVASALLQGRLREGEASGPAVLWAGPPTDTADRFAGLDLTGATIVAVVRAGDLQRGDRFLPHILRARMRGAAEWLIVSDVPAPLFRAAAGQSRGPSCSTGGPGSAADGFTAYLVRDSSAMEVLRAAGEDVAALLAQPTPVVRALAGATVRRRGGYLTESERWAPNVVGVLPGGDPTLHSEHLVVMAHMDHLGVRPPVNGDSIANGADDNASGTAGVLEIARAFRRLGAAPRRSVVFLAVSGEEKGLWGSAWYAGHPAVPLDATVADLDMDMISRGWRDSVAVIGLDFSTLGQTVRHVAQQYAALVPVPVPDPWPEQNFLYRSDHINFARRGVPILYFLDGSPAVYHQVTDEVATIDAEAAARIARLAFLTALEIADAAERPAWEPAARQRLVRSGN